MGIKMKLLQRLDKENSSDYAYRTIKQNIISLELLPGSVVSEVELASELGVSRTPVRESLIKLAKTGVVEIMPQRGTIVSLIDENLVDESCFIRKVLESAMIEIICQNENIDNPLFLLTENIHRQEFYLNEGGKNAGADMEFSKITEDGMQLYSGAVFEKQIANRQLIELDDEFHRLLFVICKKEHSYDMLSEFSIHFDRVRNLTLSVSRNEIIVGDHRKLLECITARDEKGAKEVMNSHLSRYKDDIVKLKEKCPQYFKKKLDI